MRAALGDVQTQLQDLARSVAADLAVRSIADLPPDFDADRAWGALTTSGLLDLRADGGTIVDLVVCAEEFGATLSPAPFIGSALGRELVGRTDERIVASVGGPVAIDALGAITIVQLDHDGNARSSSAVEHGRTADRTRVTASLAQGSAPRASVIDPLRYEATARVLFGSDLVGVGTAAILDAVDHARSRQQFGSSIGSFQAIQHLLADAWVDLIAARNALRSAAWRIDHDTADAFASAARAKFVADEAGVRACEVGVQVLGGLGHTWEHLMSLRLRRSLVSRAATPEPAIDLLTAPLALAPTGRCDGDGFDLRDDGIEAAFRSRLDDFLAAAPPTSEWHRTLAAAGFVGVSMPVDAGGGGLPVTCEAILSERLGDMGFPPPPAIAHLAHAIAHFATDEQRRKHLPSMIDGSVHWCQGFSEPGAGSDLAGIRTRAVLDGDHFVVNGRKIWTSEAAQSNMILLLCRTSDDRHRGLSVLLFPLDTDGVEVSTITTAWGSEEFAEVAFADVRIPRSALLGTIGQGWEIAMATLAIERGPADIGWIARFRRDLGPLLDSGPPKPDEMRAAAWLEALDATVAATLTARRSGTFDPITGSIDKLLMTKVDQLLHGAELARSRTTVLDGDTPELGRYLWGRAASVFGGTSQIQRSIVARRLLGLPDT